MTDDIGTYACESHPGKTVSWRIMVKKGKHFRRVYFKDFGTNLLTLRADEFLALSKLAEFKDLSAREA